MRNKFKTSVIAATVLALASVSAYAQSTLSTTSTVGLTATIASFDNITCPGSIDFGGGSTVTPINKSGQTAWQPVVCQVTSNDVTAVSLTAYLQTATLTGSGTNSIPGTAISWSPSGAGAGTPFATLSGTGTVGAGNVGAVVATSVAQGSNQSTTFFLSLTVPASQAADTYTGTLTVAITPVS